MSNIQSQLKTVISAVGKLTHSFKSVQRDNKKLLDTVWKIRNECNKLNQSSYNIKPILVKYAQETAQIHTNLRSFSNSVNNSLSIQNNTKEIVQLHNNFKLSNKAVIKFQFTQNNKNRSIHNHFKYNNNKKGGNLLIWLIIFELKRLNKSVNSIKSLVRAINRARPILCCAKGIEYANNQGKGRGRLRKTRGPGDRIAETGKKSKSIRKKGISKNSRLDTLIPKSNRTQGTVPASNKRRGVGRLGRILTLGKTIAGAGKKAKSIQRQGISKSSGLDTLISKSNRTQGTVPVSNKGRGVGRLGRILALGKTIAGTDKKAKSIQKQGISKDSGLDALISKSNRTQGTVPVSNKGRGVGRLGRILALGKTIAGTDKKAKSIQKQGISKDSGLDALISKSNRTQGTVPASNKERGVGRLGRMLALGKTIAGTDKKAKSIQKQGISKDSGLDALISKSNRTQGTVPVNNKGRGVGRLGRMLALGKTIAGTDKKAKSIQKQGISKDSGLDALISKSNRTQGTVPVNNKGRGVGRLGRMLALGKTIAGTDKKAKSIQKQGISKDSGLDALISKSNRIQGTAHINSKSGGNGRLGKILALDSNITEAATSGFTKLKNMGMSLGPSFSSLGSQIINSIGPIGSALEMLGSVGVSDLTLLGDAFSVLGRTMMIVGRLMMANPILAIIGLIAMAAVYIWQNWESLGPKFTQLWEGIKKSISDKWDEIVNDVKSIPEKFKKFGAEIIDGLLKGIIEKWESVKNKFFSITDWFKSWLKGDSKAEVAVKASQEVTNSSTSSDAATVIAATAHDKGGIIPAGRFGIVGEYGPEIIRGPVNVTSRRKTAAYAALGLSVGAMMPFMAAAQTAPLHFQSLPVHAYSEVQERAERNQPQQHREAPQYHIYVYGSPGQSAQDIARMVRHELEQRERMQQARLRSSFSDREDF